MKTEPSRKTPTEIKRQHNNSLTMDQIRSITPDPSRPPLNRDRSQSDISPPSAPIIGISPPPPKANSLSLSYQKHLIQMNNRNRKNKLKKANTNPNPNPNPNPTPDPDPNSTSSTIEKINYHVNIIDNDADSDTVKGAEPDLPWLGMYYVLYSASYSTLIILAQLPVEN